MVHYMFITLLPSYLASVYSFVNNVIVYNLYIILLVCSRMYSFVSRMYSYVFVFTRLLLVCTRMQYILLCYSSTLVCYSYVTRMLLVCYSYVTRMLLVCYSYVTCMLLVCYSYVTRMHSCGVLVTIERHSSLWWNHQFANNWDIKEEMQYSKATLPEN